MKLPARPPADLVIASSDLVALPQGTALWRIHPTVGPFVLPWNHLRYYGPTTNRFDPHPLPIGIHAGYAVGYCAPDALTPFAEVFQRTRVLNRMHAGPYLTAWLTGRPLQLLDLTGDWPIANGASFVINSGRHDYCRSWARAIHDHPIQVDGLWHRSAITGAALITLFTPAADSFPATPIFSRPLAEPALEPLILSAAARYGYTVSLPT